MQVVLVDGSSFASESKGIPVCNISDYCIPEVATHTIAMLMNFERKISLLDKSVKKGKWNPNEYFVSRRLSSLVLGLIGFGNIAREVATLAQSLGIKVLAFDPFVPDKEFFKYKVTQVDFNVLIKSSDYVSIHVPLNEETQHMINKKTLLKMKKDSVVLNTSRGPIIDQEALVKSLKNGEIRGASLDVLENEPVNPNDEIFELENVVITPHAAFNSEESARKLHERVAETVVQVLNDEIPDNTVNAKHLKKSHIH